MDYQEIQFEVSEQVATLTLNRPDKLNAWTVRMELEYRDALADAERREDVRVIILTGAGRGFCAGADMSLLTDVMSGAFDASDLQRGSKEPGQGQDVREDFRKPYSFLPAIRKPIIAAINGHAMGLGLVHALYCDLRFASEQAKFGTAFVQRGLIAEHGIAWLLPRLIGLENSLDLLMSGRIIDAREALQLGLVSRVIPAENLLEEAQAYARHLATQCSPRALGIIKRQVWDGLLTTLSPAVDEAISEMMASFSTEDFQEGVMSFVEKRPPRFTGK